MFYSVGVVTTHGTGWKQMEKKSLKYSRKMRQRNHQPRLTTPLYELTQLPVRKGVKEAEQSSGHTFPHPVKEGDETKKELVLGWRLESHTSREASLCAQQDLRIYMRSWLCPICLLSKSECIIAIMLTLSHFCGLTVCVHVCMGVCVCVGVGNLAFKFIDIQAKRNHKGAGTLSRWAGLDELQAVSSGNRWTSVMCGKKMELSICE